MDNIKLGLRIKKIREEHNVKQADLAIYLKIDRTTLSHYESGFRVPGIFVVWKIADYFNMSIDELVGRK